jgi:hypothetical protein
VTAKGVILRSAYFAGVCATLAMIASSNALLALFGFPPPMLEAAQPAMMAGFLLVGAPLLVLTFQPYWWGKLFAVWPGISWLGFAGAMSVIIGWAPMLWTPIVCGSVLLLVAVTHQIVDPRFSGSPLA